MMKVNIQHLLHCSQRAIGQYKHVFILLILMLVICLPASKIAISADRGDEILLNNGKDKAQNDKQNCMVLLGASYARAWDINKLSGCNILNKGIDGNQSFEMQQRFIPDVIQQNPDYVLLWGFINDIFRSDPEKLDATVDRIKASYIKMVETAKHNNIEPILATEVTIREQAGLLNRAMSMLGKLQGKSSYQDYINGHVIETNKWLRDYAQKQKLILLDLEKVLANADGERQQKFAQDDGSHITKAAYQALSVYARGKLNSK